LLKYAEHIARILDYNFISARRFVDAYNLPHLFSLIFKERASDSWLDYFLAACFSSPGNNETMNQFY